MTFTKRLVEHIKIYLTQRRSPLRVILVRGIELLEQIPNKKGFLEGLTQFCLGSTVCCLHIGEPEN